MGAEELEESEFQPMFSSVEGELRDKKSLCSGPTAGATVNGCVNGKRELLTQAQSLPNESVIAK